MRGPRIRIRSLLALVALIALLVSGPMMWQRSREYDANARKHEFFEQMHKSNIIMQQNLFYKWENLNGKRNNRDPYERRIAKSQRGVAFESRLRRKYRRVARYRWLSVGPDPPGPATD
jgi:hypothetical protein